MVDNGMEMGLDTCCFGDKTAAKTEKIAQEAKKESKRLGARGQTAVHARHHGYATTTTTTSRGEHHSLTEVGSADH